MVSDSGAGMGAETVERAFEPFFTTKEVGVGSGLGLSMVHGFVKQSGGNVDIASEVGHGTAVKIYLPRATRKQVTAEPEPSVGREHRGNAETILVVEDEAEVRKVAAELGFEVEVTTGAMAFKKAYDAFDPAVIVLDVVMPETDGIELMQWLAGRGCSAHLVVVTGYTPKYAELARKLGEASGMQSIVSLTKPVKLAALRAALSPE